MRYAYLNCDDPATSANPTPADEDIYIYTSPPALHEIQKAIKSLKNNKAAGVDTLNAELIKADTNTASKIFHHLFTNIWVNENIPPDWSKGLIVKILEKGDLQNCDNWRGVTLLSVPSKVFCKILLGLMT